MKKLIILVGLLTISKSFAQAPVQTEAYRVAAFSATLINNKVLDAKGLDPTIEGTPYLKDDFDITKINNVAETINARYNIYKDEVEFKKGTEYWILPKNENYSIINIGTKTKLKLIDNVYYITLFENEAGSLFRKDKVIFNKGREAENGYQSSKLASYKPGKSTFFIETNGKLIEIDKKTDFNNLYPNKNANEYIKTNKVDFKDENSLIKLMNFLVK